MDGRQTSICVFQYILPCIRLKAGFSPASTMPSILVPMPPLSYDSLLLHQEHASQYTHNHWASLHGDHGLLLGRTLLRIALVLISPWVFKSLVLILRGNLQNGDRKRNWNGDLGMGYH